MTILPMRPSHWGHRTFRPLTTAFLPLLLLLPSPLLANPFSIATFSTEVTVPMGHGMMGGLWKSSSVADPLFAKGVVLQGGENPVVFVSIDWCEIRNAAFDRWRAVLSDAASTTPERVLLSCIHQHDAPVADLEAQRLLENRGLEGSICDLNFHESAVQKVAQDLKFALNNTSPVTHLGLGKAQVKQIASNRRYLLPDGTPAFNRGSASAKNVLAREAPEGTIDPWLRTLSFWNEAHPIAALSGYATHPMSYYRTGAVSADFPGDARARRQQDTPECLQIYFSGASGNVTAGKYNDGSRANRPVLAARLYDAMLRAWQTTRRQPLTTLGFRNATLRLQARNHPEFTMAALEKHLQPGVDPWQQCLAAMGMSWRKRTERGHPIDVPLIDFGAAQLLLLPGESYVEFQLAAQALRPNSFVLVAGYGDGATGYLPTEKHWAENDTNLADWCWVHPGAESALLDAIRQVMLEN